MVVDHVGAGEAAVLFGNLADPDAAVDAAHQLDQPVPLRLDRAEVLQQHADLVAAAGQHEAADGIDEGLLVVGARIEVAAVEPELVACTLQQGQAGAQQLGVALRQQRHRGLLRDPSRPDRSLGSLARRQLQRHSPVRDAALVELRTLGDETEAAVKRQGVGLGVEPQARLTATARGVDQRLQDHPADAAATPVAQDRHPADAAQRRQPPGADRSAGGVTGQRVQAGRIELVDFFLDRYLLFDDEHRLADGVQRLGILLPAGQLDCEAVRNAHALSPSAGPRRCPGSRSGHRPRPSPDSGRCRSWNPRRSRGRAARCRRAGRR